MLVLLNMQILDLCMQMTLFFIFTKSRVWSKRNELKTIMIKQKITFLLKKSKFYVRRWYIIFHLTVEHNAAKWISWKFD